MREIKFRAWDTKGNLMLDWIAINQTAWNCFNVLYEYNHYKNNYENDEKLKYEKLSIVSLLYSIFHDSRFILLQFIGLKDKNGKEVYEGDILKSGDSLALVMWHDDIDQDFYWGNACGFKFNFDPDKMHRDGFYEVIGNIYENPELLKGYGIEI